MIIETQQLINAVDFFRETRSEAALTEVCNIALTVVTYTKQLEKEVTELEQELLVAQLLYIKQIIPVEKYNNNLRAIRKALIRGTKPESLIRRYS